MEKLKDIIVVGAGGHANSIIDVIETTKYWRVYGVVGPRSERGNSILGHMIQWSDEELESLFLKCKNAVIAVGQIKDNTRRQIMSNNLERYGFELPVIKAPSAIVSIHSQIGKGTTIGHGSIINSNSRIGENCIINTRALIEHDVQVGDNCHVSTGAILNGNVTVGSGSFIGSGAIIREGIKLPHNTVISAGWRVMGWPLIK